MELPELMQRHLNAGIVLVCPDTDIPFVDAAGLRPLWESKPPVAREATKEIKAVALMRGLHQSLHWTWLSP
jgi:hypothetical protein